ncbi:MAG TPA: DUF2267 domain-containing protein [Acidimicrobiia bacterium]|nr:DUF2267 domain-containing protein [Acidimicrobiia bacterium]
MLKHLTKAAMRGASIIGSGVTFLRGTEIDRLARRFEDGVERRTRYLRNAWPGIRYRLAGRHPDIDVGDDVLADRVRSMLGPVERRLDVPHVHVQVSDGIATLHGFVSSTVDAHELEFTTHRVPGIRGVTSYLHIGLRPSDTRPSQGRAVEQHSNAHETLVRAARDACVPAGTEERGVRAVLGAFLERVPIDERQQVLGHLPADARALAELPRRHGETRLRTIDAFNDEIAHAAGVDGLVADALCFTVLGAMRALVPEEVVDVEAVLPAGLRAAWKRAADAVPAP